MNCEIMDYIQMIVDIGSHSVDFDDHSFLAKMNISSFIYYVFILSFLFLYFFSFFLLFGKSLIVMFSSRINTLKQMSCESNSECNWSIHVQINPALKFAPYSFIIKLCQRFLFDWTKKNFHYLKDGCRKKRKLLELTKKIYPKHW